MKILLIHSDYIEYEAKSKAIKTAEEITDETQQDRLDESLTIFIAVEKEDKEASEKVINNAIAEIEKTTDELNVTNIMLYPYAHLSSNLGSIGSAKEILSKLKKRLEKNTTFSVKKAPFGWYKSFKLSCKGHPLSELSREITAEKKETKTTEKDVISEWCILTPQGELIDAEEFDFSGHEDLKRLYEYERKGSRKSTGEPAHVKMMRDMELVDYEPASDAGNFRWYPKGRLIKGLLEQHINNIVKDIGGMQVETPIMYDLEHPALGAYVKKFPARQYTVGSDNKDFFLRFAACFGQYMMMNDMVISYRNLPLRLYELTHYSFRREQSGELSGLKRLRTFTMPDLHTLCGNIEQATQEFKKQFSTSLEWMDDLDLKSEIAIRFVKEFYEKNKDLAQDLAKKAGKPVLVELWDKRYFYFVMKFEFNIIDSMEKASALSTVQIDVENAERFDIKYVDENGDQQHPYILHTSISGSIDRCLYALLEREAVNMKKGEKPKFPFWLSPTHIRFVPVKNEFMKDCKTFMEELETLTSEKNMLLRMDIDDRDESVSRKIRDAEKEWVPIIIVVGEKERKKQTVNPRFRDDEMKADQSEYSVRELYELLHPYMGSYPQEPLPLPTYLSRRPKFK